MPEQLPEIAFRWCRHPDLWKAFRQQQIENERSVTLVGLLLARFTGANLRGVPDPQFVTELRQQTLEPVHRAGRFDAHANRFLGTLQTPVERVGLAALVIQAPFHK
jgi:hypothetical protein